MDSDVCATTTEQKPRIFGLQIPADLDDRLTYAAQKLALSKSGVARMALDRGLTVLSEQLTVEQPATTADA